MPLIANIAQIFVWFGLGAGALASSPCVAVQGHSERMGCVTGTLFDSNGAVIVGKILIFTNVSTLRATKASVDVRGQYQVEVAEGIYELRLDDASDLLPYQRARVRILAGVISVVNLYPVQRTGFAMTVQGDVRLPDPQVSYETFRANGTPQGSGLNLVIRYEKRTSRNGSITYEGRQVVATFDEITVIAQTITLNVETLTATTAGHAVIDLGPAKIAAPSAEVNTASRVLRIKRQDGVEDRQF